MVNRAWHGWPDLQPLAAWDEAEQQFREETAAG